MVSASQDLVGPPFSASGATAEEAAAEVLEAKQTWLEPAEHGDAIPVSAVPQSPIPPGYLRDPIAQATRRNGGGLGRRPRRDMRLDAIRRQALRLKFAEFADTGDRNLRDELVAAHIGLAEHLARRFANRGEPLDDLIQVACLGLIKAVDRFDPHRGVEYSTYATPTIVGELKRHFRDKGWAVRAPRRLQELYLRLGDVVATLGQTLGHAPTIAEVAAEIETSEQDVLTAIEAGQAYRFASIDAPSANADNDDSVADRLGGDDPGLADAERRAVLSPLLMRLQPRERFIVHLRFYRGMTQSEIAARLGISQMHVSRLLARSLAELRNAAADGT